MKISPTQPNKRADPPESETPRAKAHPTRHKRGWGMGFFPVMPGGLRIKQAEQPNYHLGTLLSGH